VREELGVEGIRAGIAALDIIDAEIVEPIERFQRCRDLGLQQQRIEGAIDLARRCEAARMSQQHGQPFRGEVLSLGPRREAIQTRINGIRAILKGGDGGIKTACGG
jgi:hypothetical protein